jgi:hypothetical protein
VPRLGHRYPRIAWGLAANLLACSRVLLPAPPQGSPAGTVPAPSSPEAPAAPTPVDQVTRPSAASAATASCGTATGYRGSVMRQPVYARLARDGTRLHGRYFYEKVGVDIALEGSTSADFSIALTEGRPNASTGRFDGTCDPKSGAIRGTWSGAHASGPFSLDPVVPTDPPLVAQKRFSVKHAATREDEVNFGGCSYSEVALEFFGLRNQELERRLNHEGIAPSLGPWLAPWRAEQARKCVNVFQGELDETILTTLPEMLAIGRGGYGMVATMAHPLNGSEFEPITMTSYDVPTGTIVTLDDVFAKDPIPLAIACALRVGSNVTALHSSGGDAPSRDEWEGAFGRRLFLMKRAGVAFFADGFPHMNGVFNGHGPVLSYAVLLRDGYLRSDSPVRRGWAHVAPAVSSVDACPSGHESEWWNY